MSSSRNLTPAQRTARDIWTSGNYPEVADKPDPRLRPDARRRTADRPGPAVLDVACGAGNVAIPAPLAGADVTGLDIAPALLEPGAQPTAWAAGVDVTWVEGDAEALPFDDASFDVVTSAVGVMFCPRTSGRRRSSCASAGRAARSGSSRGRRRA